MILANLSSYKILFPDFPCKDCLVLTTCTNNCDNLKDILSRSQWSWSMWVRCWVAEKTCPRCGNSIAITKQQKQTETRCTVCIYREIKYDR